ncbi:CPBP family intramembrane glutamic endopeptidase [Rhizobium sp. YIM 134829]|uniref:CPBP family intramembrane glutamic endopeptidase n=1 Tax=Rhizobium sp. YIM 134829 TaxID=3390453 RepID=UPI00397C7765
MIILSSRYSFQIPIAQLTGRIDVPEKEHWRLLAFALAAIVAVRITVKLWARSIDPSYDFVDLTGETIFDLCVLPPLFEEPIFRGIVLTAVCVLFRDRVVPIFLFSSVIFSAMHDVSYAPQQVGTFCLNLITSVVALRTRSLSASILLHATFNAFGFV